ncbi:MAG: FeoB-associated Cys-rich membrane protein [Lachnospira sp.]
MNREKGLYQQSADADPFCQMEKFVFVSERIGVLWEQLLLESLYLQIAGGAAYSLHRDKKNGKSQCGGDCSRCGGHCH